MIHICTIRLNEVGLGLQRTEGLFDVARIIACKQLRYFILHMSEGDISGALTVPPSIVWIPSHTGIYGNDAVDKIAKEGTFRTDIEIENTQELKDALITVDRHIINKWQGAFTSSNTGIFNQIVEPTVSTIIKYCNPNRAKERILSRIRLGKCWLNHYLHQIQKHETGLCDTCGLPETLEHFLLHCGSSGLPEIIESACVTLGLTTSVKTALAIPRIVDDIYRQIVSLKRRL